MVNLAENIYDNALKKIKPMYRDEFAKFTQSGEASKEFMDYVDNDFAAQKVIDEVFEYRAAAFQNFVRDLHKDIKPTKSKCLLERILDKLRG